MADRLERTIATGVKPDPPTCARRTAISGRAFSGGGAAARSAREPRSAASRGGVEGLAIAVMSAVRLRTPTIIEHLLKLQICLDADRPGAEPPHRGGQAPAGDRQRLRGDRRRGRLREPGVLPPPVQARPASRPASTGGCFAPGRRGRAASFDRAGRGVRRGGAAARAAPRQGRVSVDLTAGRDHRHAVEQPGLARGDPDVDHELLRSARRDAAEGTGGNARLVLGAAFGAQQSGAVW